MKRLLGTLLFGVWLAVIGKPDEAHATSCTSGTLTACASPLYNAPNAYEYNLGGSVVISPSGAISGTTGAFTDPSTSNTASLTISASSDTFGGAGLKLIGNGSTTPAKIIRVYNGNFSIINNAYSAAILTLTDGGDLSTTGFDATPIGSIVPSTGAFTTLKASGAFTPTGGIVGDTTGAAPAAGYVGQIISSSVVASLAANTSTNITSVTLTPGEYICSGSISFNGFSANPSLLEAFLSLVGGTIAPSGNVLYLTGGTLFLGYTQLPVAAYPILVSSTETLYITGYASQAASSTSAYVDCTRIH
jgi:hypothetical protein